MIFVIIDSIILVNINDYLNTLQSQNARRKVNSKSEFKPCRFELNNKNEINMKRIILGMALFASTFALTQNSLFSNVSTTDQYYRFFSVQDADKDGIYEIKDRDLIVKFNKKELSTGEGYRLESIIDIGNSKGKLLQKMDAVHGYSNCVGYPYESNIRDRTSREGIVSIDDYVFVLTNMSKDGTSFDGISTVFIKKAASGTKTSDGKKKKLSFKEKMKALKNAVKDAKTPNFGPEHKALQSKNLNTYITDYLVAMKAKQDGRSAAEKQKDNNIIKAKNQDAADIKAYNDSIKATPEYAKLKAHQARMKAMENGTSAKSVTIYNKSGRDIYIYENGSSNPSRINANSSTKVNCTSNYTYKYDPNSGGSGSTCYSANSRCGSSITVN